MPTLDLVIENYKRLRTEELVHIAGDPGTLEPAVIPILQAELLNRDKKEEALKLSEFLVTRREPQQELTKDELAAGIKERIDAGEPLESIKLDLEDRGINFFDIINDESRLKEKTFEYLTSLKEEGLDEVQIDEKLRTTFGMDTEEADVLKRELRNRGKQNLIIGYATVIIVGTLSLLTLGAGRGVTIGAIVLIGIGIWRIVEGYRQRK
ncbi:MAG: hypothetical protein ABW019_07520 [Chitinophagaceae bacterium]